ncbi:MAG: YkgJ family cysteine cluster protein [Bryobacterales bacterium]|nr:YkgJ family cysteine cluster protein [Bryobacterales bacterium]
MEALGDGDGRLLVSIARSMEEAARKSGEWLVCKAGCTECCMGPFEITGLDGERLRRGLIALEAEDAARAERVRARVVAYVEGDDAPCPVLDTDTGLCDLYAWRPVTCRVFGPVTEVDGGLASCELCYEGATPEEMAACAVEVDGEGLEAAILERMGNPAGSNVAEALRQSGS